jgi:membrane-bound ClpP family serine protease
MTKAVAVRGNPVRVGPQEIVGMEGVMRSGGFVFVRGELWQAQDADSVPPGERVQVDALDGLTLKVHRIEA